MYIYMYIFTYHIYISIYIYININNIYIYIHIIIDIHVHIPINIPYRSSGTPLEFHRNLAMAPSIRHSIRHAETPSMSCKAEFPATGWRVSVGDPSGNGDLMGFPLNHQ